LAAIYVVAEEEIGLIGRISASFKNAKKIVNVAMDVTNYCDWEWEF
jgi:hypothetical protein